MPPYDPPYRLITLGRLALIAPDGSAPISGDSVKLLALLAYLAAAPGRRATRDQLIELFFADARHDRARNALRQSLHKLRAALGECGIPSAGAADEVLLGPGLTSDRDEFLTALKGGDLEAATTAYGGPFAPGMVSVGSAGFEHWADHERANLADRFMAAAEAVGRRAIGQGNTRRAHDLADRLLNWDPGNQRAWRLRLDADLATGSRVHLTTTVSELKRALAAEQRDPDAQTRQRLELASQAPSANANEAKPDFVADLVGRDREFAALYSAWQLAISGHPRHVHLTGTAGLGKTRLLEDFAVRLRSEAVRVLHLGATPRERTLPNSVLVRFVGLAAELPGGAGVGGESAGILLDLQPALSSRFAQAQRRVIDDPAERRTARTQALVELLTVAADDRPLCLLLDDTHWWDRESLDTIAHAIDHLAAHRALIVTASRPELGQINTALARVPLTLSPLSVPEVAALVLSMGEADDSAVRPLAIRLRDASDGIPLVVLQALRLGLDQQHIALVHNRWNLSQLDDFLASLAPGSMIERRIVSLSKSQRGLLLLAAVAERPLGATDRVGGGALEIDGFLELERHGMLLARPEGWVVAHDTVADAVLSLASSEERRDAHREAGSIWARAGEDVQAARAAMSHFIEAHDDEAQHALAARWVQQRKTADDSRTARQLVTELLPSADAAPMVTRLMAALPRRLRRRRISRHVAVPISLLAGVLLASGVWMWVQPSGSRDDELLLVDMSNAGYSDQAAISLRPSDWENPISSSPLVPHRSSGLPWSPPPGSVATAVSANPAGERWVYSVETAVNGPTEIMIRDRHGQTFVAPAPGDDANPAWSPDGQSIVFSTTRYHEGGSFDLAIVDLRTGSVRQLTSTSDADDQAAWSPDGTRIAFLRRPVRLEATEFCWITVDGSKTRCRTITEGEVVSVSGWVDANDLLITATSGTGRHVVSINLETGHSQIIADNIDIGKTLSPDGRWALALPHAQPGEPIRVGVFAISDPKHIRFINWEHNAVPTFAWRAMVPPAYADAVHIASSDDTLPRSQSAILTLEAMSPSRQAVAIATATVNWSSSDTAVATVDSLGILHARNDGRVTVVASAGGWRQTARTFVVRTTPAATVMQERWDANWVNRWHRYGDPLPIVIQDGRGTASFFPNGDDTYSSGAYSDSSFDAHQGLALDALLRTPITRSWLQDIGVSLQPIGRPGHDGDVWGGGCNWRYPAHEGGSGIRAAGTPGGEVPVDTILRTGRWFTLRIQIFPDGTCGYAINGAALARTTTRIALDHRLHVAIDGQTFKSQLLVGPVTVWTGVPPGVDWSERRPRPAPHR